MQENSKAFTLIELSIVLVIIGLIVIAIISGKDIIDAAEIRGQIRQIESIQSAVSSFYTKYANLPGDMPLDLAQRYGLSTTNVNGNYGRSNGDGFITSINTTNAPICNGEVVGFWVQLQDSGIFQNGPYYGNNWIGGQVNSATYAEIFPPSEVGGGGLVSVYARLNCDGLLDGSMNNNDCINANGILAFNEIHIFGGKTNDNGNNNNDFDGILTPYQAYSIDVKIDDGKPRTGTVNGFRATANVTNTNFYASNTTDDCFADDGSGDVIYDLGNSDLKNACRLGIKLNF